MLKTSDSKHNLMKKWGNMEKNKLKNIVKYNLLGPICVPCDCFMVDRF
jgi:hypothetical protein